MKSCDICLYENLCLYEREYTILKKMELSYSFIEINCKMFRPIDIELEESDNDFCTRLNNYINNYDN